jgi:outer membrane protein TolC
VQALITLQSRNVDFQKAQLELRQKQLQMSNHLWGPDNLPLEIDSIVAPEYALSFGIVPSSKALSQLMEWSNENHPEILKLTAKMKQLEIEKQWNRESLKPEINLNYSLIDAPIYYSGINTPDFNSNYKLGVDFSFPLYLRKERGKLQKTKLYIESTDYDIAMIRQQINTEIQQTYAELKTSELLAAQYKQLANNYQRLLDAEVFNLNRGESDLFKLNIQQDKYIESQRKYFDADLKFQKLKATLPYVIGLNSLDYQMVYQ